MTRSVEASWARVRWWRALGCGSLLLTLASPARAEPQVDLEWEAPAGCPQAGAVRARVRALVGDSKAALHLRAHGRVVRVDGRYRLTLSLDEGGAGGARTIESASCADLAGAAAVALGLWLQRAPSSATNASQPDATSGTVDGSATPPSAGETGNRDGATGTTKDGTTKDGTTSAAKDGAPAADQPPPSPPETPDSPPSGGPSSGREWRIFLRAPGLTLEALRLPSPSFGLGADLGLRYRDWRFGGGARIFRDQTLWSPQVADIGANLERFTAQLWTCRRVLGTRFELAPCLSLGLERLTASGVGATLASRSERATSLVFGAGANAYLYPTSWMALVGTATLSVASARPRISIDDLDEIRQLGPVALGFGLASEWIF